MQKIGGGINCFNWDVTLLAYFRKLKYLPKTV